MKYVHEAKHKQLQLTVHSTIDDYYYYYDDIVLAVARPGIGVDKLCYNFWADNAILKMLKKSLIMFNNCTYNSQYIAHYVLKLNQL